LANQQKKTLGEKFIQSHPMATIATSLTIHSSLKIANIGNIGYIIRKCIAHNIHILSSCCLLITFLKQKCCFQYIATSVKKIQVYATSCSFTPQTPSSLSMNNSPKLFFIFHHITGYMCHTL
jgi:hypothetical protein